MESILRLRRVPNLHKWEISQKVVLRIKSGITKGGSKVEHTVFNADKMYTYIRGYASGAGMKQTFL